MPSVPIEAVGDPRVRSVRAGHGLGIRDIVLPKHAELPAALTSHGARNPRVFGSGARSGATARSDLDLLVDFDPGASIWDPIGLQRSLEHLFGRKVDVVSGEGLHWLVRPQVVFEAIAV